MRLGARRSPPFAEDAKGRPPRDGKVISMQYRGDRNGDRKNAGETPALPGVLAKLWVVG
jgi:hypothetical protein